MDLALPLLTVITSIDYDHTEYLGNTLKKIAYEKAGIMKTGCTCIIAESKDGFSRLQSLIVNDGGYNKVLHFLQNTAKQ